MRDIGKNIKAFRLKNKITQEQLAESLYVTRQTISNYETGRSHPDIDMLRNIADIYKIDVETLIYGDVPVDGRSLRTKVYVVMGCVIYIVAASIFIAGFYDYIYDYTVTTFDRTWMMLFTFAIRPLLCIGMGVTSIEIVSQFICIKPFKRHSKLRAFAWICIGIISAVAVTIIMINGRMLSCIGVSIGSSAETWSPEWEILTTLNTKHWYVFIILGICMAYLIKLLKRQPKGK